MTSHARAIAAAFAMACLLGIGPSRAQQSIEEGAGDPNTALGRSMNQNQQEQQQNQQNMQRDQQNWNQYMQGRQNQQNQSNQQQGYYQAPNPVGGVYGAIYVYPADPSITRTSYNYRLAPSARAAAKAACYLAAGRQDCILALTFSNACSAIAWSGNRIWAARAARSLEAARTEATAACRKAGGRSCTPGHGYCSPVDN